MSIAAIHYEKFIEEGFASDSVFGINDQGQYPIFRIGDHDVMPFWSSRHRIELIQERNIKYSTFAIIPIRLNAFLDWLPHLKADEIYIGINWSGEKLIGYDMSVENVLASFASRRNKQ